MKHKFLLAAGALSLALTAPALAVFPEGDPSQYTVIRISGAATLRPSVIKSIENILEKDPPSPEPVNPEAYTFAYNGTNRYRTNSNIYKGKLLNTAAGQGYVIIKTHWTGDVSGVVKLSKNPDTDTTSTTDDKLNFLPDNTPTSKAGISGTAIPAITTNAELPLATVAVTYSSSTAALIASAPGVGPAYADLIAEANLVDAGTPEKAGGYGVVAITAFEWVTGRTAAGLNPPFTNITQNAAATLLRRPLAVSVLTGNPDDKFKYVYAVGRSQDGGARTVPIAEAQLGFTTPVNQFQLEFLNSGTQQTQPVTLATGGANATVKRLIRWPASWALSQLPEVNWGQTGNSGYNLTSDLANVLSAINPVLTTVTNITEHNGTTNGTVLVPTAIQSTGISHIYFVGYNGSADTQALLNTTDSVPGDDVDQKARRLSYNGVPYSADAVRTGQYSLWSYGHLYYRPDRVDAAQQNVIDLIADDIFTVSAPTNGDGLTLDDPTNTGAAGIFYDSRVLVRKEIEGGSLFRTY
jgi:hypothetical protein